MKLQPLHLSRMYAHLLLKTKQRFSAWESGLKTAGAMLLVVAAVVLLGLLIPAVYPVALTLLCPAGALVYLYHQRRSRLHLDPDFRPDDALAEVISIDAYLIRRDRAVLTAFQPFEASDHISLTPASGLMLCMAIHETSAFLPRQDASATQDALEELHMLPEAHFPSLETLNEPELFARRVQDGASERWYYAGSVERLLALCEGVWDVDIRPLAGEDRARILAAAGEMAAGFCDAVAYATCAAGEPPVFLGLIGIGDRVSEQAAADIREMRRMGLIITLTGPESATEELQRLRTLLHLKDIHPKPEIALTAEDLPSSRLLKLRLNPGDSLVEPILWIRDTFSRLEKELRLCLLLLLPVWGLSLTTGWAGGLSTAVFCYLVTHFSIAEDAHLPKRVICAALAVTSLLSLVMLSATAGSALGFGLMGLMLAAASALRASGLRKKNLIAPEKRSMRHALIGLGAGALCALVIGLISGISLLPTVFTLMMGAAMSLLILLGR